MIPIADKFRPDYKRIRKSFPVFNDTTSMVINYIENDKKEIEIGWSVQEMHQFARILSFEKSIIAKILLNKYVYAHWEDVIFESFGSKEEWDIDQKELMKEKQEIQDAKDEKDEKDEKKNGY